MSASRSLRLPEDLDRLAPPDSRERPQGLTVAAWVFGQWHRSALNDRQRAPGWTEYHLLRGAVPHFPGHEQPRTPWLGELDERDPRTWDSYVTLAADHGVDVLLWCWYWCGQPVLHEALEEGFLQSRERSRVRFAVMWTNQPFRFAPIPDYDPDSLARPEEMWRSLAYIVANYFGRSTYWHVDGRPFLAVWMAGRVKDALGVRGARAFFDDLRGLARRLGHDGIHLHASQGSTPVLSDLDAMGFDSYGLYNPILPAAEARPPEEDLVDYADAAAGVVQSVWQRMDAASALPCFPCASPGWDDTPRWNNVGNRPSGKPNRAIWPGRPLVVGSTPAAFEALLRAGLAYLNARPHTAPVLQVGSLNEWTEGHYLLPDTRWGHQYLQALARAVRP